MNFMIKAALTTTILGSATIIVLCFGWYTVMGEGPKGTGEYWTAYKIDKICQQTHNPNSWECYRAELHRKNALDLADWEYVMNNKQLSDIEETEDSKDKLEMAFGDSSELRKKWLSNK